MASYANPIFYREAADCALQPDALPHNDGRSRKKRKRERKAVPDPRERSRSPITVEPLVEDSIIGDSKSPEIYEVWKADCRKLFWKALVEEGLIARHICVDDSQEYKLKNASEFDNFSVIQAYLNLLTVVPDNGMVSLTSSGELAPMEIAPRRPVDWKNYRLNLWKCITPIGAGNRIHQLVELFINFVKLVTPNRLTRLLHGHWVSYYFLYPVMSSINHLARLMRAFSSAHWSCFREFQTFDRFANLDTLNQFC